MTKIEFFFDPICPFCWITSRWLLTVSEHREIDITWRQFSLALKNDVLKSDDEDTEIYRSAHRVQRVISQAAKNHGASKIELYSEFGIRHHIMEKPFDDEMIKEVLAEKNLPSDLLASADDETIDEFLQAEIDAAIEAVGPDIGVPTIVFSVDGKRTGYFGPVLNELPATLEESLAIWDGLSKLAKTSSFYEIKRSRSDDPNVFSAARC